MSDALTWTNEQRRLSDLVPWDKNPRQINKEQARRLRQSLAEFGQVQAICIDPDNMIIDGHQRKAVWGMADEYGMDYVVDVRVASRKLTDKEQQKLTIFLGKGAAGEWDFDALANFFQLDDLLDWGFDERELDLDLWPVDEPPEDPGADLDRAEELREKWGVETGQLWELGEHRLICGDCTDAAVVERLMGGERAEIEIHDPPYGMRLNTDWSSAKSKRDFAEEKHLFGGKRYDEVKGDDVDFEPAHIFSRELPKELFLWGADYYAEKIPARHDGSWLVWDKRLDESADKMYGSCFELCWSMKKHKRDILRLRWSGVFGVEQEPERRRFHPTQKPVGLYERLLEKYSKQNNISSDWYLGVGSHLLACERLSRRCYGCEIEPKYVSVVLERWHEMTGEQPVLLDS